MFETTNQYGTHDDRNRIFAMTKIYTIICGPRNGRASIWSHPDMRYASDVDLLST